MTTPYLSTNCFGLSIVLRKDRQIEPPSPLEFFQILGERGARASAVLPALLLCVPVLALFFIGIHVFIDDDGLWSVPIGLDGRRHHHH